MSVNTGNIYSIPEHPAENYYCEIRASQKDPNVCEVIKKVCTPSLPEEPYECTKTDLNHKNNSIPSMITSEVDNQHTAVATGSKTFKENIRLSVSLVDFSHFSLLAPDRETLKADKVKNAFANMSSSCKNFKSYLEVQDCISHTNNEPEYETLLSPNSSSVIDKNHEQNSAKINNSGQERGRKGSNNLIVIYVNDDEKKEQSTENLDGSSVLRQRSRSLQWIQNTFQNVSNKYKYLLEFRRPSDIAEERMRRSQEELEMEESESDVTIEKQSSTSGSRRYSENVIEKQKKFPFATQLGHLKDLWRDRNAVAKRQEEKDIDQTRTDVCPLFTFPRKRDEDEQILDALRQAMRKCTAVDPTSRPTSTTVLDQLSNLLEES